MPSLSLEQLADSELPHCAIRLIYFDIDGTLLNREGHLPVAVANAVARVQAQGVLTAFATGRPAFATQVLQQQLAMNAPSVFYTGALCSSAEQCFVDAPLTLAELAPLLDHAETQGYYCEIYYRDQFRVQTLTEIGGEHARHLGVAPLVSTRYEWPDEPVYKLLLGVDLSVRPEGLVAAEARWPQFQFAYAHLPSRPHWQFASVVSKQVNKTELFQQLLAFHGLHRDQVMAFGDGGSDCEFLRSAGIGVAMGNASLAVQACSNFVTRSSSKDGVAYALDRLILST